MPTPNILYIHSHDTGRYVQPYGHAVATPNVQTLAEGGVLFRQAFCAGPTCSPSRASLLTGQWPHCNGMVGLAHRGFFLNDYSRHLVHTLRKAGYVSALSGIQHIANGFETPWQAIGYDRYLGSHEEAHTHACALLNEAPQQPFFLSVGFHETHRTSSQTYPSDSARYCLPPPPLPDTPETRLDMAWFTAEARVLDGKIGCVLDALERNGLAGNTLVICTTDHGIAFPRMKCNLTDAGIGVMLILRGPGGFTGGTVCDGLISQVDIFPTLCDLIGLDPPDWLQGTSLMPVIRGEAAEVREELFAEINYHAAYEPQRCVRTRRWKYIRRFDHRAGPVLPNCDDSPSKTLWLGNGWRETAPPEEALYDLVFDPNETNNLVGHPAAAAARIEMKQRLERWMRDTDDPLLSGGVPAPAGAVVNDPDGTSPQEKPRPAH